MYELGESDRKQELRMSSQTLKICNNTLIRDDLPPSSPINPSSSQPPSSSLH
jgi:hypothetical protein